jgi:hypothetical protein
MAGVVAGRLGLAQGAWGLDALAKVPDDNGQHLHRNPFLARAAPGIVAFSLSCRAASPPALRLSLIIPVAVPRPPSSSWCIRRRQRRGEGSQSDLLHEPHKS